MVAFILRLWSLCALSRHRMSPNYTSSHWRFSVLQMSRKQIVRIKVLIIYCLFFELSHCSLTHFHWSEKAKITREDCHKKERACSAEFWKEGTKILFCGRETELFSPRVELLINTDTFSRKFTEKQSARVYALTANCIILVRFKLYQQHCARISPWCW